MLLLLTWLVAILLSGTVVYCVLVLFAARSYLAAAPPANGPRPPVTLMKPLAGLDEGLKENLRSYFRQDYPDFEVLLAVRDLDDPAARAARAVMNEFPEVPSRLVVAGVPPTPNGKVFSLRRMLQASGNEIIVMTDSDTRAEEGFLSTVAAETGSEAVGLVTCPYRVIPGGSLWSELEAIGLNTEFTAGILAGRLLLGMDFALGPAIATRRSVIERIGGFKRLQGYLAEDFVLGKLAASAGQKIVLSSAVIEHRIGSQAFRANFEHRLRWARSTRRSRPLGYVGQIFTCTVAIALLSLWALPALYPLVAAALVLRAADAWAVSVRVLRWPLTLRRWLLLPVQDLISFGIWLGGFFGNNVTWRGSRWTIGRDGAYIPAHDGAEQPAEIRQELRT